MFGTLLNILYLFAYIKVTPLNRDTSAYGFVQIKRNFNLPWCIRVISCSIFGNDSIFWDLSHLSGCSNQLGLTVLYRVIFKS